MGSDMMFCFILMDISTRVVLSTFGDKQHSLKYDHSVLKGRSAIEAYYLIMGLLRQDNFIVEDIGAYNLIMGRLHQDTCMLAG